MILNSTWTVAGDFMAFNGFISTPYGFSSYLSRHGKWQYAVSCCFMQQRKTNKNWG